MSLSPPSTAADSYGGMQTEEAKRPSHLEKENVRHNKLLAEAELEKAMLKELALFHRPRAQALLQGQRHRYNLHKAIISNPDRLSRVVHQLL